MPAQNAIMVSRYDCTFTSVDAAGAWEDAVALAERQRLPVWATPAPGGGRIGFPENHPNYRGVLPPAIGPVAQTLEGHDLILVVGSSVFPYYPYIPGPLLPEGAKLVAITSDPDEAARAPMGDALVADVKLTLEALLAEVPESQRPAPEPNEVGQFAVVEEDGILRFVLPDKENRFDIPLGDSLAGEVADDRGLSFRAAALVIRVIGVLGGKELAADALGAAVRAIEKNRRPYRMRTFESTRFREKADERTDVKPFAGGIAWVASPAPFTGAARVAAAGTASASARS